jgi:basic membrane protein A
MLEKNSRSTRLFSASALLCLVAALVAGCGGSDSSSGDAGTTSKPAASAKEPIKIGLIQEDRAAAEPWAAAMFDAATKVTKEDPAVSFTESYTAYTPAQALPVMRQFANQGYKVVVGHSFFLEDVIRTLGREFPKLPISGPAFKPAQTPNVSINIASYLETGYATGWMLAKLSKTGKIAVVGAQPAPYATEIIQGVKLGAKAADPKVEVLVAWSNSFTDQQATQEQAKALLDEGADGLFPVSATQDALGGFKLCEERKVNCASWAADGRRYAPTTNVVSAVIDWAQPLRDLVEAARAEEVYAETWSGTFGNEGLILPPLSDEAAARVPAEVTDEFKTVIAGLASEEIKLPVSKAHPCCR